MSRITDYITILTACALLGACGGAKQYPMGTYGYDAQFLRKHDISTIELCSADGQSKVMLIPAWQGRVMTTSACGDQGDSYGWINYKFIEAGAVSPQFNPVGGEERFWFGPEGGPFSLYFKKGQQQVYENWVVPPVIDTEGFEVAEQSADRVVFTKQASLVNASDTRFDIGIRRTVSLLGAEEVSSAFGISLKQGMKMVAYSTENVITNNGAAAWTKQGGLVSVWMLGMFTPTPTTTVFIPYNTAAEGTIVNDEYFGKVPADRLKVEDGMIYFKIDGQMRTKIGIPGPRARELCGSYDSSKGVLTLLWCGLPEGQATYVNGQWGEQDDPFNGDAINSYNDGPVADGSIMGPFYEIETSSPGAELAPGGSLTHTQKVLHIQGSEAQIAPIVKDLFGVELGSITAKFQ